MGAAEHRIGRVVFDIDAPDRAALDGFEAVVRASFDSVISPALETALDRIDRAGALVRLGRVEIDLGAFDPALDAGTLAHLIIKRLEGTLDAGASGESQASALARDDAAELAAFLETGELPWAEPGKALDALAATLLSLDAIGMTRLATRLRTVLIRPHAVERLLHQMPATFVRRLLRALLPDALSAHLSLAFGPDAPSSPRDAATVRPGAFDALGDAIRRIVIGSDLPELGDVVALYATLDNRAPQSFVQPSDDRRLLPESPPASEHKPAAPPQRVSAGVPLPIHAAGAVLLHPFLATFFGRIGLLDESGRFRNQESRSRGVLLAHYAATGADDAPEPETVLFKLLCGMEFSFPVPRRVNLTGAEREEVNALLVSVIAHWKRLGHTSPDGLRRSFLCRPGQLDTTGDEWRLIVERRGVDVLLQDLPWALSHVKTPFMRALLRVDWR